MYLPKNSKTGLQVLNRFQLTDHHHYDGRETTQLANFVEKNDDDVAISKVDIDRKNEIIFQNICKKLASFLRFSLKIVHIEFFFLLIRKI